MKLLQFYLKSLFITIAQKACKYSGYFRRKYCSHDLKKNITICSYCLVGKKLIGIVPRQEKSVTSFSCSGIDSLVIECFECFSQRTLTKGKYHCTTGLQFNKIGFDQKRKYVVISRYVVKPLNPCSPNGESSPVLACLSLFDFLMTCSPSGARFKFLWPLWLDFALSSKSAAFAHATNRQSTMDQRAFVFATRGQCIKGKQC